MTAPIEVESTLTDRYQTTVPEMVRRALKLGKRDKIHYIIQPDGGVVLRRAVEKEYDDPILEPFLCLIAQDMAAHPERLQRVDSAFMNRIQSLSAGIEVDLDAPLMDDDE